MNTTITVNGTTFTGEMILDAVERTTGFPELGIRSVWHPHQLVTDQEYDAIKAWMLDNRMDLIEEGKLPAGDPRYIVMEMNLGGWRFLYTSDSHGDLHTRCFSF